MTLQHVAKVSAVRAQSFLDSCWNVSQTELDSFQCTQVRLAGNETGDLVTKTPASRTIWENTCSYVHQARFFPLFSKYIYNLCSTKASLIQSTTSVLTDFETDGVVYLELRTTPRAIPSENLTKSDYISTILSCITDFNVKSPSLVTKLILSIDRRNTLEQALEVVDLALAYRDQGVVGIDLCGDPAKGDVSIFRPAFQKAKDNDLNITIHFAEAPASATEKELRTLLEYEPKRIGHVIHVPEDIRKAIVERKLGLELCLSCNVHAKMITGSFGDHHFGEWWGSGCPVVLGVSFSW